MDRLWLYVSGGLIAGLLALNAWTYGWAVLSYGPRQQRAGIALQKARDAAAIVEKNRMIEDMSRAVAEHLDTLDGELAAVRRSVAATVIEVPGPVVEVIRSCDYPEALRVRLNTIGKAPR
jgi:hypothetical protein